jgi:hypothetical protein
LTIGRRPAREAVSPLESVQCMVAFVTFANDSGNLRDPLMQAAAKNGCNGEMPFKGAATWQE